VSLTRTFKAFLSYADQDEEADPWLVQFAKDLERRVNAKLVNARFEIWRDKSNIRPGDKWNQRIEAALQTCDILIVILTPRWIASDFCRNEFRIFEEVEKERAVGDHLASYVVPVLVREIAGKLDTLTEEQRAVYNRIASRQAQRLPAERFLKLRRSQRLVLIDKIADDLEGMIERRQLSPAKPLDHIEHPVLRPRKTMEFDASAQNYERVDFVSNAEVICDQRSNNGEFYILAQIDFVERLYIQSELCRIDFGIRRAFLLITNEGAGQLSKVEELKSRPDSQVSYYVTLHDSPDSIAICMNPSAGKTALAELRLPIAKPENYFGKVAKASSQISRSYLKAELKMSLDVEGLHIFFEKDYLSEAAQAKIKAIMAVVAAKAVTTNSQTIEQNGQLCRALPIQERS
jgi:hypothetical protein